jgi:tetratricopeptide (TPR) repeat protein
MPRQRMDELPDDVTAVTEALRKLAGREGASRTKLAESTVLLSLVPPTGGLPSPERARRLEDFLRAHVNSLPNLQNRALLVAGLNLDGAGDASSSLESRITNLLDSWDGAGSSWTITADGAIGRFKSLLLIELAWRLLGGAPTRAAPRPPSNELEMVERLRRQHRDGEAVPVLRALVNKADGEREQREAWRLLATIAYERADYDEAEAAFSEALKYVGRDVRGGKLAVAIDRCARRLTDEEQYDRALAMVDQALVKFIRGRWLWRRRGCVKWYAGDLLDAYASLTYALNLGYPASRVFHARGQVLAEMGRYRQAIDELEEALKVPRSDLSVAQARSARAFAIGMNGDLKTALAAFRRAEQVTPDSGWLHYWRALCLIEHGQIDEATASLERAERSVAPRLPSSRLAKSIELIKPPD